MLGKLYYYIINFNNLSELYSWYEGGLFEDYNIIIPLLSTYY